MIRVLVVDETPLLGRVMAAALESNPGIHVVGCAHSVDEALERLRRYNVVLASASLPEMGVFDLIEAVAHLAPWVKVLVIGTADAQQTMVECVEAGAAGYLFREEPVEQLAEGIRRAHQDGSLVLPEMADLAHRRRPSSGLLWIGQEVRTDQTQSIDLTSNERQVLHLIRRGLQHQEIADYLNIDRAMARQHVQTILRKLNTRLVLRSFLPPAASANAAQRVEGH
jgi:DNA-binding NarL/FixJ family response regulator